MTSSLSMPELPHALLLSARDDGSLRELADRLCRSSADDGTPADLERICHSAALRRGRYSHRLTAVGYDREELRAGLVAFVSGGPHPGIVTGTPASHRAQRVAFVFPGQGWEWLGMGRDLLEHDPVFRDSLARTDRALRPYMDWTPLDELSAPDGLTRMERLDVSQPTLFAMAVGLSDVWRSWGVEPDVVIGHSVGETAAACVAGILTLDEAAPSRVQSQPGARPRGRQGRGHARRRSVLRGLPRGASRSRGLGLGRRQQRRPIERPRRRLHGAVRHRGGAATPRRLLSTSSVRRRIAQPAHGSAGRRSRTADRSARPATGGRAVLLDGDGGTVRWARARRRVPGPQPARDRPVWGGDPNGDRGRRRRVHRDQRSSVARRSDPRSVSCTRSRRHGRAVHASQRGRTRGAPALGCRPPRERASGRLATQVPERGVAMSCSRTRRGAGSGCGSNTRTARAEPAGVERSPRRAWARSAHTHCSSATCRWRAPPIGTCGRSTSTPSCSRTSHTIGVHGAVVVVGMTFVEMALAAGARLFGQVPELLTAIDFERARCCPRARPGPSRSSCRSGKTTDSTSRSTAAPNRRRTSSRAGSGTPRARSTTHAHARGR